MVLQAAFFVRTATLTAMLCSLVGCITLGPDYDAQRATAVPNQPKVWQPPVAHDGSPAVLQDWWSQFGDPTLVDLIVAAQEQSQTMAQAAVRIAQTRALLCLLYTSPSPRDS